MRQVEFTTLPAVGPGGSPPARVSLDEFVRTLPYVLLAGAAPRPWLVPPLAVLNSVFESGRLDAGMSGGAVWGPFRIDEAEYDELVAALRAHGYEPAPKPAPAWVTGEVEWRALREELQLGIPAARQLELWRALEAAHAEFDAGWDEAVRTGDPTLVVRRWRAMEAARRAVDALRRGGSGDGTPVETPAGDGPPTGPLETRLALRAAERIGDPELIEHWREQHRRASGG